MSTWPNALAGAALLAALVAFVVWAVRQRGLASRPVLLALTLLGFAPALVVAAGWAARIHVPYVRFEQPWAALPVAALVAFIAIRLVAMPAATVRGRRRFVEIWSASAAIAAGYAACGLSIGLPLDRMTVVVAIDRSRSIDLVPDAAQRIATELRAAETSMRDRDRLAVVAFGSNAVVEEPARPKSARPSAQRSEVSRDGTDLGAAIQKALTALPPDAAARVVLLTDGVATRGDVERHAMAATALGVPVDAVVLEQRELPNVRLSSVRLSPTAAEGEALFFRIVTQASAETAAEFRIYRDGELVRKGTTRIAQGEDVVTLREIAKEPGLHRYDVEISSLDGTLDRSPEDNVGSAFVRVRGPSRALVLEADLGLARAMADALKSSAFEVDVRGPAGVPVDVAEFGRYDLVVLGDISAADVAPSQLAALAAYVRDAGGGLLLMGGERSLGPGGYGKTPIEEVSPVSFDLKQERRRASLAEIIAVDYSGSMAMQVGNQTKLDLANEAAARSAELLGAGDRLGIMHVDTQIAWTVPLGPVRDKAEIASKVRKVAVGGGGIYIDLTLTGAYEALARESVQLKHLLLFSDGADAEERSQAFGLVARAKRRGITTSVVALGNGSDVPALSRMAELGGGRFYLIQDATRLPAVFAQETILATRSAINEVPFVPRATSQSAILRGVDFAAAPALSGYVVTLPKPRAELHLQGPEGDPLLATWSAGIGRSAVFTSDYRDRWGARWTEWEGAARLFAQLGRDLARRADDPRVRLDADTAAGELSLSASVVDERGRAESFRRLRAKIVGPDGAAREIQLEAVGGGGYRAKLPLTRPGAYLATVIDEDGERALATTGAVLSAGEELRPTGSDRALLRRVTELTNGTLRENLAGIFGEREARRFGYTPLAGWLSALAAVGMLLSVAGRRLVLPDFRLRRKPGSTASSAEPNREPRSATFSALRRRKQRHAAPPAEARPPSPPQAPRSGSTTPKPREPSVPQTPTPSRPKSAAEILLERRRARSPK